MGATDGWARARDRAIAILGWIAIFAVIFAALAHVITAVLLVILGALLAYVLTPLVAFLHRAMPRWLAIAITYVVALALLGTVGYVVVQTAVTQLSGLSKQLPSLLAPPGPNNHSPIFTTLERLGMSDAQIAAGRTRFLDWLQGAAGSIATKAVPILTGVANALLDLVLTLVISIYLIADGPRLVRWLRTRTPISQRTRISFALNILDRNVGGYVRGELFLASLIGVLVGTGMWFFRLPYALLLGVLAFVLEFIPILGVFISGAACVLVALTQGFPVAIGVFIYFVFVHIIEGDVVGPRIIGKVLGLHPVLAILALIVAADVWGFWGALFAAPVAGVIQAVVVALWEEWRDSHPADFPPVPPHAEPAIEAAGHTSFMPRWLWPRGRHAPGWKPDLDAEEQQSAREPEAPSPVKTRLFGSAKAPVDEERSVDEGAAVRQSPQAPSASGATFRPRPKPRGRRGRRARDTSARQEGAKR